VFVVGLIDPTAPFALKFDARPAVDPYRLPPVPMERPTDPGSNRFAGKHGEHLYLRAAIACVPIKGFFGLVIDRRTIVSRHLL